MLYTVLYNLKFDGHLYQRGDAVELNDETAKPLLKDGIISSEKVPTVVEKDWKTGPQEIKRDEEQEVTSTGEIVDGEGNPVEETKTEESTQTQPEPTQTESQSDEVDENAGADL